MEIINFKIVRSDVGNVKATFDVRFEKSHMIICNFKIILTKKGFLRAFRPSYSFEENGERKFAPIFSFENNLDNDFEKKLQDLAAEYIKIYQAEMT